MKCGSMPISFQRENRDWKFNTSNDFYEEENEVSKKRDAFLSFQRLCIDNDIRLGIVFPPNFQSYNSAFENRIKALSNENTLFFRYDTLNIKYTDKAYYYDEGHLQKHGAIMFTNEIIKQMKREETRRHNKAYNSN